MKQALAGRIADPEVEIRGKLHEVPECILRELDQETALFVGDGQARLIIEEEVLVECSYLQPALGFFPEAGEPLKQAPGARDFASARDLVPISLTRAARIEDQPPPIRDRTARALGPGAASCLTRGLPGRAPS